MRLGETSTSAHSFPSWRPAQFSAPNDSPDDIKGMIESTNRIRDPALGLGPLFLNVARLCHKVRLSRHTSRGRSRTIWSASVQKNATTLLWRVGVDVGGTFTDIVARRASGEQRQAKTLTTPVDPLGGLIRALGAVQLAWTDVAVLVHGTTLITNSLVENRLGRTVLVTTAGFEDVLEIGRASRDQLYRLDASPRVAPVVARDLVIAACERTTHDGAVLQALSDTEIARIVEAVKALAPEAIAISLLHSYANPAHEQQLSARLCEHFSCVSMSSMVSPEAREFERATATCLNAAVMPRAARYLDRLAATVPPTTVLHLFHSAGGMAPPDVLRELPLTLAQSGPAAGAHATMEVCRALGIAQAVGFDMGGTTTDVCLVNNGKLSIHSAAKLGGYPVRQPMVAIESVGAGGGSIVRAGSGGLSIGPDSAGSNPGPACYGLGGVSATITDVNALLGFLDPSHAFGGEIRIDVAKSKLALQPVADQLGVTLDDAALGVMNVANAIMARALAKVTVQQGIDLRQSTLVAFGGAGPMHAASLARHVGIAKVLVPNASSAFSAFGCVTATPMFTRQKTIRLSSASWSANLFQGAITELEAKAREGLGDLDSHELTSTIILMVRYVGQSVAVEVPCAAADSIEMIGSAFREAHSRVYGYATSEPFLVDSIRVTVEAPTVKGARTPEQKPEKEIPDAVLPYRTSTCIFDRSGNQQTPWFNRERLPVGVSLTGPCILADDWSTIVIPPKSTCHKDEHGHIHIVV